MLSLELVPKVPHGAAHDCLMTYLPKLTLRVPPVPSAKKKKKKRHETAIQPAYLGSSDASADSCSNSFRLLPAEH